LAGRPIPEIWEPLARLTAKPADQAAMAASLGDVLKLATVQSVIAGEPDVDRGRLSARERGFHGFSCAPRGMHC